MWDELIIKTRNGFQETGVTTIKTFEIPGDHSISDNARCFRIDLDSPFAISITIFKDTKEGIRLTKMIEEKETLEYIEDQIARWYLKRANPKDICEKIKGISEEKFNEGRESKAAELRSVLGVLEY